MGDRRTDTLLQCLGDFLMNDKDILVALGRKKAEYANSERTRRSIKKWYDVNDKKMTMPPVFLKELPWHEIEDNDLILRCEDPFLKQVELELRRELYLYEHFKSDNVVSTAVECPIVFSDSGFGIEEKSDIIQMDSKSDIVSRSFHVQIETEEDVEKIREPVIELDIAETERRYECLSNIFDGVIDVVKTGVKGYWFTPWDNLIRLVGIENLYFDLIDRPDFINMLVKRFVDVSIVRLERYKELGLWASNNNETSVGSGGAGFCHDLVPAPTPNCNVETEQIWGCGNAQIFSEVSPEMHWEFSLQHEVRWLSHFGLNYYGCCEQLHHKFDILERIPHLRKISMSPWADLSVAAERAEKRYVLSVKPNPAVFVGGFSEAGVREQIRETLEKVKSCEFEIVMKDMSTLSYRPDRLAKWCDILQEELAQRYSLRFD